MYLKQKKLKIEILGRGIAWLDTGSASNMLKAGCFVETIQSRQGFYIACLEEIAWRNGFIDSKQLKKLALELKQTDYGKYIMTLLDEEK